MSNLFARAPMLLAAALLMPASIALSQANRDSDVTEHRAERCSGPEHREFDFWLGSWDVRNAEGDLLGHNEIRRIAGGCGLLESWRSAVGGEGMSINAYDSGRKKWTQRWVGAGAILWLEGSLEDGQMVLAGIFPRSTSRGDVLDRITWTPLPDGRVRQVWDISTDSGKTWRADFVGYYSAAGHERSAPAFGGAAAGRSAIR